ncbi:PadR family transcriptional regulator [Frondihabitans cladoniiphilus]|uniref:PadR family transcriptional regulator n=1 Tax=Frondihabitans cladoniiphilus TaxID=715785 RepID=A0ABP8WBM0_9MICO
MSSIRLFILDAFAREGEMHGHQLRLLAEKEHVHNWTDITVGAIYGAIKRLAADGLLEVVRTEREGNFPERHVYAITDAGLVQLASIRTAGLVEVTVKPDPFDLALARIDPERLDELPGTLQTRRARLLGLLDESVESFEAARPHLTYTESRVLSHRQHRIRSEIEWLDSIIADLPAIVADETDRLRAS